MSQGVCIVSLGNTERIRNIALVDDIHQREKQFSSLGMVSPSGDHDSNARRCLPLHCDALDQGRTLRPTSLGISASVHVAVSGSTRADTDKLTPFCQRIPPGASPDAATALSQDTKALIDSAQMGIAPTNSRGRS
jgi:hypothetical protein